MMQSPPNRSDLFSLSWLDGQKTWHYLSTGLLCILILFVSLTGSVQAQSETSEAQQVEVPQALGPEAMQSLVSKLDEEQTAALVELMDLLQSSANQDASSDNTSSPNAAEIVKKWFTDFSANLKRHLNSFPQMAASTAKALTLIFQREEGGPRGFLLALAVTLGIGVLAEWLFKRFTREMRERIRQAQPNGLIESLKLLSKRASLETGGVIIFTIAALVAADTMINDAVNQALVSTFILTAILITRMTRAVMHFVLAPRRPELRLVYTDSWNAQFIERQIVLIAAVVGFNFFVDAVMRAAEIGYNDTLRFWMGLVLHLWLIVVILRAQKGLTQMIEGGEEGLSTGLKRMANWWPVAASALVAFNWLFVQFVLSTGHRVLTSERSAAAISLIVVAPFLDTMVRGIAAHLVPSGEGSSEVVAKAYHETRLSYIRIGRVLLLSFFIIVVGKLWGLSLNNLAEAGFGAQVAANAVGFLLILAIGYIAWEITNLSINKRLAREVPEGESGGAEGGTGQTRMATVLPILRMTLQASVITITVLLALSQLGVNIAPLLAGAGVLGLAIGFGAQTLVKDVVSGVFFLLDDAFRVGEFITVGTTMGIVSKISVRSLQLRQDTGQLHIIPYGSMSQLTNNSRDWVTLKLRFTVPFDTDQDQVRKIFKKIGQDMMEVPELAEVLINPFKSQGAADVTDVGIVIRGKFSTVPGGQFIIRKEVYNRVQKAFEAAGIEFARKEVRVSLPENVKAEDLSTDQKEAIAAAASDEPQPPKA